MAEVAEGPRPPAARIASIDALRGFALCGILLINIFEMGGPVAMERPLPAPSLGEPDWLVWAVAQLFVAGTMRGLFSLLFGVGLLIFVGDDESADRSRRYLRRLVLLFLFGLIDCTLLLWPGDILITYALAGVVVLILHPLKPAWLLVMAVALLVAVSGWEAIEAGGMAPGATVYGPDMIVREGIARLGGYWLTFDYMSFASRAWMVNALIYRSIGDTAALMLVGMALYRLGLFGPDADERIMLRMASIGYGVGLLLRLAHVVLIWGNDGGPTFVSALVDQPGRLAMTLGHLGFFQLLWRRAAAPRLKARLAEMGRMALTLYLSQSLMAAWIFSGFGLGLWNQLSWPQLWLVAATMLAVEALFAAFWFRAFRYGPAEWLWRWGTYGKRPALLSAE